MINTLTLLAQHDGGLNAAGTVVMAVSILCVLGLCVFCIRRVLSEPDPEEHMHTPLEIDTHDTE